MDFKNIIFEVEHSIAKIILNTPKNYNAMSHEMYVDIQKALDYCKQDGNIRAIILKANGRAFSGGGDIAEMMDKVCRDEFDADVLCMDSLNIVRALRLMPKPVVAATHGAVAGSGFVISLSCDILVAEEDTRFYLPFVNIGLIPDASGMFTLTRVLGLSRAVAKAMMGEFFTVQEGLDLGFVCKSYPKGTFEENTLAIARKLADGPTKAYAGLKELAYIAQFNGISYEEYLPHEVAKQTAMGRTHDFREGITAFLEKRKAVFIGK